MELYTACWKAVYDHHKALKLESDSAQLTFDALGRVYTPVRISRKGPRYWPAASAFPSVPELMPEAWMMGGYSKWESELGAEEALEKFQRCYRRKLHELGVEAITKALSAIADEGAKPLVLLCFEVDPNECHRGANGGFAAWWERKTGINVPDLDVSGLAAITTK